MLSLAFYEAPTQNTRGTKRAWLSEDEDDVDDDDGYPPDPEEVLVCENPVNRFKNVIDSDLYFSRKHFRRCGVRRRLQIRSGK